MRFTIKKKQLVQALQQLKSALPPKRWRLHEMFYYVLVQASSMGITLTATNGDMRLSMRLGLVESAHVIEAGGYAVSYTELTEALKAFPRKADLLFCLEERGLVVAFDSPLSVQVVRGRDFSAFPDPMVVRAVGKTYEVEEFDGTFGRDYPLQRQTSKYTYQVLQTQVQRLVMQRNTLLAMVEKVAFAAARDDSRPLLMTIYTQLQNDDLSLVASDGFLLAEHCAHIAGAGTWEYGVPIWARYFLQGLQLMSEETPQVTLECYAMTKQLIQRNVYEVKNAEPVVEFVLVRLQAGRIVVELRAIVGTYPNHPEVLAQPTTTLSTCETAALLAAVEKLAPLAKAAGNALTLSVEEDHIRLEVTIKTEEQREGPCELYTQRVPAARMGDKVGIILDYNYILTILRVTPTRQITVGLTKESKPAVLRPTGDSQTTYVVMPMTFV